MTSIAVTSTGFQVEKRSWFLGTADLPGFTQSVTLDVSAFTAATHFPNGFFPSGLVVARITAASDARHTIVGPYEGAAVDGRGTAYGLLFSSVKVPNAADTTVDVGGAALVGFAPVSLSKLPVALDAAGQVDLQLIYFAA